MKHMAYIGIQDIRVQKMSATEKLMPLNSKPISIDILKPLLIIKYDDVQSNSFVDS